MRIHLLHLGGLLALGGLLMAVEMTSKAQDKTGTLKGKRVAILVANGFEQSELEGPKLALEAAGAKTTIVSPEANTVKAWKDKNWGGSIPVDVPLDTAPPTSLTPCYCPAGS